MWSLSWVEPPCEMRPTSGCYLRSHNLTSRYRLPRSPPLRSHLLKHYRFISSPIFLGMFFISFLCREGHPYFLCYARWTYIFLCLVGKSRISYFVWGGFIRYRLECSYALEALFLFDPGPTAPPPPPPPPPNLTGPFASVTFSLASLVGSRSHSGCLVMVSLTPLTLWIHCIPWHFLYLHCAP